MFINKIKYDNNNLNSINELEYHNGYIYANRYLTNNIYLIDINNNVAIKKYDMSLLYEVALFSF